MGNVKLTAERLRLMTLPRQFPDVDGTGVHAVVDLFRRVGPVQSQVPRAPFTSAAARLPGVTYEQLVAAFETDKVVKNSNLRGTVHTVVSTQFAAVAAVAQATRSGPFAAHLKLDRAKLPDLIAEIEAYCDQWQTRADVVAHARGWLAAHDSERAAALLDAPFGANFVWGHAGLLRRPPDGRWERRTDTLHRTASAVLDLDAPTHPLKDLVRIHLAAHGPATRRDLAWWSGDTLGRVDNALTALGDEVEPLGMLEGETYWDLASTPHAGRTPAGWRLLPEYDALVCAYAPAGRSRFLPAGHGAASEKLQHRQYSPLVLHDGRMCGTWRLVTSGSKVDVEISWLPGEDRGDPSELADAVSALARANNVALGDVRAFASGS